MSYLEIYLPAEQAAQIRFLSVSLYIWNGRPNDSYCHCFYGILLQELTKYKYIF